MKYYYYFITYDFWQNGTENSGRDEIKLTRKIDSMDVIKIIEQELMIEKFYDSIKINNFILFREEECNE